MTNHNASKTLEEVIDHVEQLREELLTIQNALEKLEAEAAKRTKAALPG